MDPCTVETIEGGGAATCLARLCEYATDVRWPASAQAEGTSGLAGMHRGSTVVRRSVRLCGELGWRGYRRSVMTVAAEEDGERLDFFCRSRFAWREAREIEKMIFEGHIEIDGRRDRNRRQNMEHVFHGDQLRFPEYLSDQRRVFREKVTKKREEEPQVAKLLRLLTRDFLVADKDPGVLITGDRESLTSILALANDQEIGPIYPLFRLPKFASGVVLFGRSSEATSHLFHNLRRGSVQIVLIASLIAPHPIVSNAEEWSTDGLIIQQRTLADRKVALELVLSSDVHATDLVEYIGEALSASFDSLHCEQIAFPSFSSPPYGKLVVRSLRESPHSVLPAHFVDRTVTLPGNL